jgi:AraC-like DNA-binding protein
LLRTGQCNVTEAALDVGYNSLSHFSAAFHEAFGCCPGLYPLRIRANTEARTTPPCARAQLDSGRLPSSVERAAAWGRTGPTRNQ